jgi:hypothetical protein
MMKHLLCYILPEVLNRNHHEAVRETRNKTGGLCKEQNPFPALMGSI